MFDFNFLFHSSFSWLLRSLEVNLNQGIGALRFLAKTGFIFQIIIFIYYYMGEIRILEVIRRVNAPMGANTALDPLCSWVRSSVSAAEISVLDSEVQCTMLDIGTQLKCLSC